MMDSTFPVYHTFEKKLLMVGFGGIGQAVLPLILRHLKMSPQQITIINKKNDGMALANACGVNFVQESITRENYRDIVSAHLSAGDFLLNLSVEVSSIDLIKVCQEKDILYLDTCVEPWAGGYTDKSLSLAARSNYVMREEALTLKNPKKKTATAVLTHGANPGMVSHFVKQALMNIAKDNGLTVNEPKTQTEWAMLAHTLNIKVIHVAERDTQIAKIAKRAGEFVNTWSCDGFVSEGSQPAELGWGTHERHWPHDAHQHEQGTKSAIYLNRPGAATRVRTWTPLAGAFHGYLITHAEAISIADYFTLHKDNTVIYRPTVHYAYHPCEDAVLSINELAGREWQQQPHQRILFDEIVEGMDELGVLLMGNEKGAYWYGSQLTIDEARQLISNNNATTLQVASSVFAGVVWTMRHPDRGIVEPDEMEYREVMEVALPYLGKVSGYYTDWTPLKDREKLFAEPIDKEDPWQFINIRVQ